MAYGCDNDKPGTGRKQCKSFRHIFANCLPVRFHAADACFLIDCIFRSLCLKCQRLHFWKCHTFRVLLRFLYHSFTRRPYRLEMLNGYHKAKINWPHSGNAGTLHLHSLQLFESHYNNRGVNTMWMAIPDVPEYGDGTSTISYIAMHGYIKISDLHIQSEVGRWKFFEKKNMNYDIVFFFSGRRTYLAGLCLADSSQFQLCNDTGEDSTWSLAGRSRSLAGRSRSIGVLIAAERAQLRPLVLNRAVAALNPGLAHSPRKWAGVCIRDPLETGKAKMTLS